MPCATAGFRVLALFLLPVTSHAVICKFVDADGVVSYTDVPGKACQESIQLRGYSRYAPRPIQQPAGSVKKEVGNPQVQPFQGYKSIKIEQPEARGTVRSNEGRVPVGIALEPPMQEGHRIKVFVDGGAVPGEFDSASFELNRVERGTHTLRAVVSDAGGRRLGDSPSVRFTLQRTSIADGTRPLPPGQPVHPIEPGPVPQPGNGPATSGTPGKVNPAYTPNYGGS